MTPMRQKEAAPPCVVEGPPLVIVGVPPVGDNVVTDDYFITLTALVVPSVKVVTLMVKPAG